jgi:hypothetical protein
VAYNICKALNKTVLYYKTIYYENDYYRHKKLFDVQEELKEEKEVVVKPGEKKQKE